MEEFLRLLGHDLSGLIAVRFLFKDKKKSDDTKKSYSLPLAAARELARRRNKGNRSVYIVINGPGHEDIDITLCRAIFYEHDELGKELSMGLWEGLWLPRPSFQVDTGGKSIHSYWVLSEPVTPDRWRPLQADLIEYADGDRQCKNPSRVMRCPGYIHPETGQMATIVNATEHRYSFEELRAIVPVVQRHAPRSPLPAATAPLTNGHFNNLGKMIAVNLRPLLEGAQDGSRNSNLYRLGMDLAGVEQWMAANGYQADDRAWDLFYGACLRSNPPMGSKPDDPQPEEMWARILRDCNGPSLSDDKLRNIVERKTRMSDQDDELEATLGLARPGIEVEAGNLKNIREEIIGYLAKELNPINQIYVQGNGEQWLTRILTTNDKVDCCQKMDIDKITQAFDDRFSFYQNKGKKTIDINCPVSVAKNFYNASRWDLLPKLTGIIKLPVLKMDGTICMKKGYDPETGYLMDFNEKEFCLKEKPTKQDAINSLKILKDLISESSFESDKSRSGALSMLLTAVSRNTYDYAPLHAISANTPGAGKGTLTQLATIFATGKPSEGMTTFNPEETELKKSLISVLMRGSSVVSFDNISRSHIFGGAEIETALTNPAYSGRILGGNEMGSFSTKVLWLANGNRLKLTLDMGRRTILVVLDSTEENAFEKEYKRDLIPYATKNRGKLVSAALTILQAFLLEKPVVKVRPLNGFGQWSRVVRNALIWLGEADPAPSSKDIYQLDGIDEERAGLANLLEVWHSVFICAPTTTREALNRALGNNGNERLRTAFLEVATDKKGQLTSDSLGKYLRGNAGTRIGNMRFVISGRDRLNSTQWGIEIFPLDAGDDLSPASSPASSPAPQTYTSTAFSFNAGDAGDKNAIPTHEKKDKNINKEIMRTDNISYKGIGGNHLLHLLQNPETIDTKEIQVQEMMQEWVQEINHLLHPRTKEKYYVKSLNIAGICTRVDLEENKAEIDFLGNDETNEVCGWFGFDDLESCDD